VEPLERVRRVLIIAPDYCLWSPVGRTLGEAGHRVVVATDVRDGREILERGRFDLAFLAIGAPASVWRQDALALREGTSSLGTGDSMLSHLAMIALIGISFAAGNLMFMRLVQTSGPVFASQNACSIMLFGIAWGVLLLGEHLSDWAWAAILLVLLGLFLVGQRNTEPHEAEAPAS
jgi:drug/metabolite transporter (DMT)-like permease